MKTRVLQSLGETALGLPAQVDAGLAANDRLKYYFSLLQMARGHADHPGEPASSLKDERQAAAIADGALDHVVAGSRKDASSYQIPGCAGLMAAIAADAAIMAAPADQSGRDRLAKLLPGLPKAEGDLVDGEAIDTITRAGHGHTDSLHQLVMDLHKSLNALQAGLAEKMIAGASTYHLGEGDAALVEAFMGGLNRTAALKFDHPGLSTTATRSGARLVIQNDIGTTDAHVIVIHVEGRRVSLTTSDVHLRRLRFFQDMLSRFAVTWTGPDTNQVEGLAGGAPFYTATGVFNAADDAKLLAYLDHLGSRLVFLIDWNRARKQLRGFLDGEPRLALLRWAAEHDIGHRGFLQLGGAELVWSAVDTTAASAIRLGDRLCDVLGAEATFAFMQFVFTTASEGLRARLSENLMRERIRAELFFHLHSAETRLLLVACDHAGLIFELATALRDHVADALGDVAEAKDLQKQARKWEHGADALVVAIVEAVRRRPELATLRRLISVADDAADNLEEACFLLGLLDGAGCRKLLALLEPLTALLAVSAQEWVKALGHAGRVRHHGLREEADDFLVAIDRLANLEHQADAAERELTVAALKQADNFRALHMMGAIGHALGDASDALKRSSIILRDHVVGDVLAI